MASSRATGTRSKKPRSRKLFGLSGGVVGWLIARADTARRTSTPPPEARYGVRTEADDEPPRVDAVPVRAPADRVDVVDAALVLRRLEAIDARLARIESQLAGGGALAPAAQPVAEAPADARVPAHAPPSRRRFAASPDDGVRAPDGTSVAAPSAPEPARADADARIDEPVAHGRPLDSDVGEPDVVAASIQAPAATDEPPPRPAYGGGSAGARAPGAPSLVWQWITGGNALTRIGIVILFFGVAFLLRWFAEIVTVPIELKLAGAAAGGVALAALGFALAKGRPAYGLSLQGAGTGIVYLTVFAAFRLYSVLPPAPAIALLVVVAAATVALALKHDSQPLAGLALAGGFLAPVLIRTDAANPALLFGYFAILNAAVLALAWKRAWRALNVLGFVFTFVLGLAWGWRFYTPAHYAVVQPYLALFFAFYVGIAILYARGAPLRIGAAVDGVLVFGVPIVGFALQMAIARGYRYGVAWSAGTLALVYGVLGFALRRSVQPGLALLSRAFAALAIIFATLAVPFAADPRETSAWWALEAAGVYALGVMQRQPLARAFALLLQLAAAVAFVLDRPAPGGTLLLNASFLGAALIGAAALASVWAADRGVDRLSANERALVPWMLAWGAAWWLLGGVDELRRIPHAGRYDASLAWFAITALAGLLLHRWLAWPRIAWLAAPLPVAIVSLALADVAHEETTLTHYGWLVWPASWAVHWAALRVAETLDGALGRDPPVDAGRVLRIAHAASAIALVAWASWELAHWGGRRVPDDTAWRATLVVIPSLLFMAGACRLRASERWPFGRHMAAYGATAGTVLAGLALAWLVVVNFASRGDPAPLPYLPLLNPLDLTLVATLGVLAAWDDAFGSHAPRVRYSVLGAAAFLALNGVVVRTAHHWGDVPWRLDALAADKALQAALTLTWTVTALAVMVYATRRGVRALWIVGAALLGIVVVKLFALDLAALSGLTRVVAFMGVGLLLLVIGYVTPFPPAVAEPAEAKPLGGA
jgi:uncharacterized membrane protein